MFLPQITALADVLVGIPFAETEAPGQKNV